jgi:hypothetical protein
VGNREVKARLLRDKERGARSWRRRDVRNSSEALSILFLKYVDVALATARI